MRWGLVMAAVLAIACQRIHRLSPDGGQGGGGSTGGGGAFGGGGGTGGGSGACVPICDGGCGPNNCGGYCRIDAGLPSCDPDFCVLAPPPLFDQGVGPDDLRAISGTSSSDVWIAHRAGSTVPLHLAYHLSPSGWTCINTAPLISHGDIWASDRGAVIVGSASAAGETLLDFSWDGGAVSRGPPDPASINAVWSDGMGQTWVATDTPDIWRYDANGWSREILSGVSPLKAMHGQVLAGGPSMFATSTAGQLYVRQATTWLPESAGTQTLVAVFAELDGGAWVVGDGTGAGPHAFVRVDAGTWAGDAVLLAAGEALTSVSGRGGQIYVGSEVGSDGVLRRRDPTLGWQTLYVANRPLTDLWVAPNGDVWGAGKHGMVLRHVPPKCPYLTPPIADEFDLVLSGWRTDAGLGSASVDGGVLRIFTDSSTTSATSVAAIGAFDLVGRSLSVAVTPATVNGSNNSVYTYIRLDMQDGGGFLNMRLEHGALAAEIPGASREIDVDAGTLYLRFRELAGTLYFESGPDPSQLDETYNIPAPPWLRTADRITLGVDKRSGGVSAPALFDHLNRCLPAR